MLLHACRQEKNLKTLSLVLKPHILGKSRDTRDAYRKWSRGGGNQVLRIEGATMLPLREIYYLEEYFCHLVRRYIPLSLYLHGREETKNSQTRGRVWEGDMSPPARIVQKARL